MNAWGKSDILLQKIYQTGLFELILCNGDPWHGQIVLKLIDTDLILKVAPFRQNTPGSAQILWFDNITGRKLEFEEVLDSVLSNVQERLLWHLDLFR